MRLQIKERYFELYFYVHSINYHSLMSIGLFSFPQVYAWGRGEHGRLGFGDDKSSKMVPQKVQFLQGENVIQV